MTTEIIAQAISTNQSRRLELIVQKERIEKRIDSLRKLYSHAQELERQEEYHPQRIAPPMLQPYSANVVGAIAETLTYLIKICHDGRCSGLARRAIGDYLTDYERRIATRTLTQEQYNVVIQNSPESLFRLITREELR